MYNARQISQIKNHATGAASLITIINKLEAIQRNISVGDMLLIKKQVVDLDEYMNSPEVDDIKDATRHRPLIVDKIQYNFYRIILGIKERITYGGPDPHLDDAFSRIEEVIECFNNKVGDTSDTVYLFTELSEYANKYEI